MSYQICSKSVNGVFEVPSDSSSSKVYKVDFRNSPPTCTCIAYAIARNRAGGKNHGGAAICKHINSIYDKACDFDSRKHGESMLPICPHCGDKLQIIGASQDSKEMLAVSTQDEQDSAGSVPAKVTPVTSRVAVSVNKPTTKPTDPGSLLTKLGKKLVQFNGVVVDAGGGEVRILVDRDTLDYPPVGCKVRVVGTND